MGFISGGALLGLEPQLDYLPNIYEEADALSQEFFKSLPVFGPEPVLQVSDITEAIVYYEIKLGFTIDFKFGTSIRYIGPSLG